ncbi:Uncharacterized protein, contains Zn-finger domain of CHY type [Halobacillus alkaliphilus]|uniref:Uncharacterized protein, contains Zn-finger domain of CHY type n=1 Tax=Halobacillus alkaliphilus TaxID=396056 RepID=A0A1I2M594_9BACI|nr:CHY zinc finger protein [Halobacillus alkaliphilus]SFF86675.1 Uncharacterized protein, contains Zn-finger domain of CHY type [Halobacillus alkaliphilus]
MNSIKVKGTGVDEHTRCAHYHSNVDIVAVKFYCCQEYYGCYYCHKEKANHSERKWPKEQWEEKAILCGNCWTEFSIQTYMKVTQCPACAHPFNEKCSYHYPLYFEGFSE